MNHVITAGTFDLIHYGHAEFLKRCSDVAGPYGYVTVLINTDKFVLDYKKQKTVMPQGERQRLIQRLKGVDMVLYNDSWDLRKAILRARDCCPKMCDSVIVAIGTDWARKDYWAQTRLTPAWLEEKNIGLLYLPYTNGVSSTDIRKRLA